MKQYWVKYCYEIGDIVAALSQRSGMTLLLKKSYLGEKELPLMSQGWCQNRTGGSQGKGTRPSNTEIDPPTLQIQIVIGRGEGKATREFEIIRWPEIFSTSNHGKTNSAILCFQSCFFDITFQEYKTNKLLLLCYKIILLSRKHTVCTKKSFLNSNHTSSK